MSDNIKLNAIKCAHCSTLVVSTFRHHFATHKCAALGDGYIAADGGLDYLRRVGNPEDWEEASEWNERLT